VTGPGASLRRAESADLSELAGLWLDVTRHHSGIDPLFTLRAGAGPEVSRLLDAQLSDPNTAIFVWESPGRLLGFCTVRVDRAPPILEETVRAEITDLGVRADARRRGIGGALADAALAWARAGGTRRVEVRVAADNREGQAFWRALGFGDLMDVLQRRL
jgi:ribosomal protein S18 acetylase RimI-like enzyme